MIGVHWPNIPKNALGVQRLSRPVWTAPGWEASTSEMDVESCPGVPSYPVRYLWKSPELAPMLISSWLARNQCPSEPSINHVGY